MIRAEDVKAGIAEHKPKACTSVLPYLKSKQIHVEHNPAVKGSGRKPQATPPEQQLKAMYQEDPRKLREILRSIGALSSADNYKTYPH